MSYFKVFSLFSLLIFLNSLSAQDLKVQKPDFFEKGKYIENAKAVVLLDSGFTSFTEDLKLAFQHTQRILILDSEGEALSKFSVPFAQDDSLLSLSGSIYQLKNDQIGSTTQTFDPKAIKKQANGTQTASINLKGAKKGDIIEFVYTIKFPDLNSLNTWYFQSSLPVKKSTFTTKIPSFVLYYKFLEGLRNLNDLKRTIIREEIGGDTYNFQLETFMMQNLPAFKQEDFIPGNEYFISKITFHLAEYTLPGQSTQYLLPSTYEELAYNWASDPYFSQVNVKSSYLTEKINQIYHSSFSDEKNIQSFYYFVRNNFEVDNSLYEDDLKETFERRAGNEQQINMLLAKMLNQAGFSAYLVALSTIENRPTYPDYPYFELFNKFVVMVRTLEETYFLDASDQHLLFNMLSPNCITNGALVISKANDGLFPINYMFDDRETVTATLEVSDSLSMQVNYNNNRYGYGVYAFDAQYLENFKSYNDYLIETIFNNPNWNILKHDITDGFEQNKVVSEALIYEQKLKPNKFNELTISPIIQNDFLENPYKIVERQNPITIYTPISYSGSYTIKIPSNYTITTSPKAFSTYLPDSNGAFEYTIVKNNNELKINYTLNVNKVVFMPSEYVLLSTFFHNASEALNQKIVIKKN